MATSDPRSYMTDGNGYPFTPPSQPAPQQPTPGYPAQQSPPAYPAQQPTPGYPAQQPTPGYPAQQSYSGYPAPQPGPYAPVGTARPGNVVAAAVIGYVLSAFLFLAGLIILVGTSMISSIVSGVGFSFDSSTLDLLAIANLAAGGLLIAGGVAVTGGKASGRTMMSAAAAICLLCGLRWIGASGDAAPWALGFCAPALLAVAFLWQGPVSRWLAGSR